MGITIDARAQLDQADRAFLVDLYQATDGDNWQVNEGWLGPEGTECRWARVECINTNGHYLLMLSSNQMTGELPDSFLGANGLVLFNAGNNAISGSVQIGVDDLVSLTSLNLSRTSISVFEIHPDAAPNLRTLIVTDGSLSGPFPPGLMGRNSLKHIDLSHNSLSGALPTWLGEFELERLRLAGNSFSGSITPALEAMITDLVPGQLGSIESQPAMLDLRGNLFAGGLSTDITSFTSTVPEWINLCWNPLDVSDPAVLTWLEQEHRAADFDRCLGRTISDPSMTASGSWFNPERAGEGFSIMLLDDGQTLVHWFTYAQDLESAPRQSWLLGNDTLKRFGFDSLFMYGPEGGRFGEGLPNPQSFPYDVIGALSLIWTDEQRFESNQEVTDEQTLERSRQSIGLSQLTQLAGTTCDNRSDFQAFSGAWFNPERSGEGFVIEVLPNDRVVVYWFSYAPDDSGQQAWLTGDARFDNSPEQDNAEVSVTLFQTAGAYFGDDFAPQDVQLIPWGSIDLTFIDENSGQVSWSGPEDFGSGSYSLTRLAQPLLAECD